MSILISHDGHCISEFRQAAKRRSKTEKIALHAALDGVVADFYKRDGLTLDELFGGQRPWDSLISGAWMLDNEGVLTKKRGFTSNQKKTFANENIQPKGIIHEIRSPTLMGGVAPFLYSESPVKEMKSVLGGSVFVRLHRELRADGWIKQVAAVHDRMGCFESPENSSVCKCCRVIKLCDMNEDVFEVYDSAIEKRSFRQMARFLVRLLLHERSSVQPFLSGSTGQMTDEIKRMLTLLD